MSFTWAPIPGWPGYEVSDLGHVRSWRHGANGRELGQFSDRDGYARVNLCVRSRRIQAPVHRLVLLAFVGEPPDGRNDVRHLDGNPRNNQLANLAWGSQSENEEDKRRHGTALLGVRHFAAKLDDDAVRVIRSSDESGVALALRFGVSRATITSVRCGKTWRHVS